MCINKNDDDEENMKCFWSKQKTQHLWWLKLLQDVGNSMSIKNVCFHGWRGSWNLWNKRRDLLVKIWVGFIHPNSSFHHITKFTESFSKDTQSIYNKTLLLLSLFYTIVILCMVSVRGQIVISWTPPFELLLLYLKYRTWTWAGLVILRQTSTNV